MNDNKNTTAAQPLDLDKLEALARAATPGPWRDKKEYANRWRIDVEPAKYHPLAEVYSGIGDESCKQGAADSAFIAAANPQTVLALIAQARASQPEGATGTTGATVIWPSEKFVHERIATLMSDIGMSDDTSLWNAFSRFEADLRSRVEAMPSFPATATASIDTLEFQALAGTWCGAAQSCDQWTRTIGAKQAWADLIAYIDASLAAPASAQPDRGAFERWARSVGYEVDTFKAEDETTYSATFANVAWEAWQAALSNPSPASQPVAPEAAHADDLAVDRFAAAMKAKMAQKRAEGRGGWDDKGTCSAARLQVMLVEHLAKGDPVDIGNFAMMLWNRGEPVAAPTQAFPNDGRGPDWAGYAAAEAAHAQQEATPVLYVRQIDLDSMGNGRNPVATRRPEGAWNLPVYLAATTAGAGQEAANAKDAARWTKTPPTEQADYWNWDGDPGHAPMIYHVMWSGTSKKCFVSAGQYGIDEAIWCDNFDGWWLKIGQPSIPSDHAAMAAAPSSAAGQEGG